jgi:hypothetical protein
VDGVDVSLLLKNAGYRKQAVMPEDYPLLVEFWDMIHAARPARPFSGCGPTRAASR